MTDIKVGDRVRLIHQPEYHGTVLAHGDLAGHAVVQFDSDVGKGATGVQYSQLEHYGAFLVVGCEQYGDWSYIPINDRGMYYSSIQAHAEAFAKDLMRSPHRKHIHLLEILHEDPGNNAKNEGPWVCVFLRDGFWTVTNGFSWKKHAEDHAEKRLRNAPADRNISNVTVRRLPLPAGYKKE